MKAIKPIYTTGGFMKKNTIILLLLTLAALSVQAKRVKEPTIQQRLAKLEQQAKQQPSATTNVADLVIANEKLQQQVAQLKGIIEEQNHRIDNLKEKQKLLYLDMDSRLAELEANNSTHKNPIDLSNNNPSTPKVEATIATDTQSTVIPSTDTISPQLSSFQDDYDIAFAHLRAGRFLESARAFEDFIQKYPNNELTDNAYYWLGESYYVKRQYPQALAAFQSLTSKFPNSSKAPDSWLKIGYSYYEMDDLAKADENLKRVINNYPNSSVARLAQNRLRQLQRDH